MSGESYYDKTRNIFIEINERQTGKSIRLAKNIIEYIILTNENVAILVYPMKYADSILDKITYLCRKDYNNLKIDKKKIHIIANMSRINYNMRVYVDEFDFIPNFDEKIKVRDNMYFCTTLNDKMDLKNKKSSTLKILKNINTWRRKNIIDIALSEFEEEDRNNDNK